MAIALLPKGDSPTLAVVPASKEEMANMSRKNGSSWRGALSIEAYLRREEYLAQTTLCRNGGLTGWILIDTAASERFALAGCETIRKRALISVDGEVEEAISHGIGSVFCPVECRKRGYGVRMMKELGKILENWQTEENLCPFSILYSDIGKKFYATIGWHPYPSAHVNIASAKTPQQDDEQEARLPAVQPLFAADLASLCTRDEILIRRKLEMIKNRTAVALVPDLQTMEWHHGREDFVSNELFGKKPFIKGAMVADENGRNRVWCIWTRMWYNEDREKSEGNTMHILRLVVEDDDIANPDITGQALNNGHSDTATNGNTVSNVDSNERKAKIENQVDAIQALLLVARQEAHRWHCASVETWNPSEEVLRAAQRLDAKAALVHRDSESIASLQFYRPSEDRVEWICNEKYGWC